MHVVACMHLKVPICGAARTSLLCGTHRLIGTHNALNNVALVGLSSSERGQASGFRNICWCDRHNIFLILPQMVERDTGTPSCHR